MNLEWVMFDFVSDPNSKALKPGPYWASNKLATRAKAQVHGIYWVKVNTRNGRAERVTLWASSLYSFRKFEIDKANY